MTDLICDEIKEIGLMEVIRMGLRTYESLEPPNYKAGDTIKIRRNPLEEKLNKKEVNETNDRKRTSNTIKTQE